MAAALLAGFTACSNDDNNDDGNGNDGGGKGDASMVTPSNVFTGLKPTQSADILSITYDSKGRVTHMVTADGEGFTLTYAQTRDIENQGDVQMVGHNSTFYFQIGSNGFAKNCMQYDAEEDETIYWTFGYTEDGHLNYVENKGEDIFKLTYENGDVAKVEYEDPSEPEFNGNWTVAYSSSSVPAPIDNKGCLMLFDTTLGIDLDELGYAYYAGLLGKATGHLPLSFDGSQSSESEFQWMLDSNGYPTELKYKEGSWDSYKFAWK